jgi:hypothetical protein
MTIFDRQLCALHSSNEQLVICVNGGLPRTVDFVRRNGADF